MMNKLVLALFLTFHSAVSIAYWPCMTYTEQEGCRQEGCTWDASQHCLSPTPLVGSSCSSATRQNSCENIGCLWQKKDKKCLSSNTLWGAECKTVSEGDICENISGCIWDSTARKCLANGYRTKSACQHAQEEQSCEKLGCNWDDKTGCLEKDQCLFASARDVCSKLAKCVWDPTKLMCLHHMASSCEYVSKNVCLDKFKNECVWDSKQKICITKKPDIRTFDDLDPKTKKALLDFLKARHIREEHLFRFELSRCHYHSEKEACGAAIDCIWDQEHTNCTDKHTVFCGFLGQTPCENVAHCIWDDVVNTCFNSDVTCTYFKSERSCDVLKDRCDWDRRHFCRPKIKEDTE